ncbi:hypothetical protein CGRA01v4_09093 [Colletotrichum graminicola]|nr:hypothetical protein CGRA01v4_09093 [Colletotrichum graminicola]
MANDKMYDVLPGRESAVYDGTKGNEAPHVASEKAINMDDEPAFLENSPTNMLITRVIQTSTSCNAGTPAENSPSALPSAIPVSCSLRPSPDDGGNVVVHRGPYRSRPRAAAYRLDRVARLAPCIDEYEDVYLCPHEHLQGP